MGSSTAQAVLLGGTVPRRLLRLLQHGTLVPDMPHLMFANALSLLEGAYIDSRHVQVSSSSSRMDP